MLSPLNTVSAKALCFQTVHLPHFLVHPFIQTDLVVMSLSNLDETCCNLEQSFILQTLLVADFVNCQFKLLSRLFDRVDLMKPVSNVRPYVRAYICPSIRPQKVSSISI